MKLSLGQQRLFDDAAMESEMNLRTDYSGRGMYGKTCYGVEGSVSDLIAFVLFVANEDSELAKQLANVARDAMGLSTIYYWPSIEGERDDDN